jgi:predicted AlkP superfamily phosphohydrolase/phosphomutase
MLKYLRILFLVVITILIFSESYKFFNKKTEQDNTLKLYWFIPDGLRAEPELFNIYKWANNGELPNIKRLMDKGSYGFSIPDYPSHTPVNFATLLTGSHPRTHGVSDGAMHVEGYPLNISPFSGFRSNAKKVPAAWSIFEDNKLDVFLLSMPGSTPPELSDGITVRGRWGGWGADFYAVNFQDITDELAEDFFSRSMRLFYTGPKLTETLSSNDVVLIPEGIESFSKIKEIKLEAWDKIVYGFIYDGTDDRKINYDNIAFSLDKKKILTKLSSGDWSDWLSINLKWRTKDDFNMYTPKKTEIERKFTSIEVPTEFKIKIIKLTDDGKFRIRFFYNNLNKYLTVPSGVAKDLTEGVGPMVDFVDNYPPQLIYYPEDKQAFLEEAKMSLDWHKKAVSYIIDKYSPEVVLHDTYTPNQMLTSRWWLGYLDPQSLKYNDITEEERGILWQEVKGMYKGIDDIIGGILDSADENTYIVFSSDHGAAPLNKEVYLNNYFAKKGWLEIKYDEKNKIYDIDWDNTKVAFLRMNSIYINPNGLGGNWKRGSGLEYEKLREEVIKYLQELKDDNLSPMGGIVKWENVEDFLDLPTDRVGDLIVSNNIGYGWSEEVNKNMDIFKIPLKSGYKQAIDPQEKAVWTPFIIAGPGVKEDFALEKPINHVDQLPTILDLMKINIPDYAEGKSLDKIFK